MKVGIVLPMNDGDGGGRSDWPLVRRLAEHADTAGMDSLWVCDHLITRFDGEPEEGIREGWTMLSAVAAVTEHAALGTLVTATPFRSPALLGKMAAALDEIGDGRLILGLGTGGHEPEFRAFGYPFDHLVGRFEESLKVIVPLLRGERVTFHGRWTSVDDAILLPPPRRPGSIPILVAASRPRLLRLTARYADAWNTNGYGRPDERFDKLVRAFRAACDAEGRDSATIEVTAGVEIASPGFPRADPDALPLDVDAIASALDAWAAVGVGHVQFNLLPASESSIDLLLEATRQHRGV